MVEMEDTEFKKCRAIVKFGPATDTDGFKPAEYFQVTIDPSMTSPEGNFIRFGLYKNDEIFGWQRVAAMTVCEVLEETPDLKPLSEDGYTDTQKTVVMRKVI